MARLWLMRRSLPPMAWFRSFESAARHLSFTSAATELGVTQSAISQNVRALENKLATPLFLRKARGLALTDAGRQLLPDISTAMSHISNAVRTFETPSPDKLITVAMSASFAQWCLVPQFPDFQKKFPHIRVRIITTVWPDDFLASSADVEIRFGSKKHVGHRAERLKPDNLILVASPKILPKGKKEIDLQTLPFIQTVGTSNTLQYWTEKSGLDLDTTPRLFADTYGLAVDFAENGAGVALVSSLIAAPSLAKGRLRKIHPAAIEPIDGYYLAANNKAANPQITDFTHWLKSQITTIVSTQKDAL